MATKPKPSQATFSIEAQGINRLKKMMRVLSEPDAPFIKDALKRVARQVIADAQGYAKGHYKGGFVFGGIKRSGANVRALVRNTEAGATSFEFGREVYYRGYTGRKMRSGQRFHSPKGGQKMEPMLGVIHGDAAIGKNQAFFEQEMQQAVNAEWERLAAGPDVDDGGDA